MTGLDAGILAAILVTSPSAPKAWERTAAEELRNYLTRRVADHRLTAGGTNDIRFVVADMPDLADEEWRVVQDGDEIRLGGGGSRGTLYAVAHFLEDCCGVRWWSDKEEDVPQASDLTLPKVDLRGKPAFTYRDIYRTEMLDGKTIALAIWRRLNRTGGEGESLPLEWGGAFEYGKPKFCHTFDKYLSWREFGGVHPEWFSLVKGKRHGGGGFNDGGQLCFSNPEVVDYCVGRLRKFVSESIAEAKAKGAAAPRLYDFSMNDNKKYCECEKCKADYEKWGITGQYLRVVNRLAAELEKLDPQAYISTFAYYFTEELPKGGIRPAKNVVVRLCNTRVNLAASILANDGHNHIMRELVCGWNEICDNLHVWDYDKTYTKDGSHRFPFPSEMYFQDKLRFYRDHGVKGVFWEQEDPDTSDLHEIKYYLKTKILEDPDCDYTDLLERTFAEYFGEDAGRLVLTSRRRLAEAQKRNNGVLLWFPQRNQWNFIREADLMDMESCYDRAEAAVKGDAVRLRRVKHAREGLDSLAKWRRGVFVRTTVNGRSVYHFPAEKFCLYGKDDTVLINDGGRKAVELRANGKGCSFPLLFAYYDATKSMERKKIRCRIKYDESAGNDYKWYDLGETDMSENGYFYFGDGWTVQIHQIAPDFAGRRFRVRALISRTRNGAIRIAEVELRQDD